METYVYYSILFALELDRCVFVHLRVYNLFKNFLGKSKDRKAIADVFLEEQVSNSKFN